MTEGPLTARELTSSILGNDRIGNPKVLYLAIICLARMVKISMRWGGGSVLSRLISSSRVHALGVMILVFRCSFSGGGSFLALV